MKERLFKNENVPAKISLLEKKVRKMSIFEALKFFRILFVLTLADFVRKTKYPPQLGT